jgi:hypothetical protein
MWPYNYCEWKSITYGIKNTKSKWQKNKNLILMCTVPSIVLIWMLSLVF